MCVCTHRPHLHHHRVPARTGHKQRNPRTAGWRLHHSRRHKCPCTGRNRGSLARLRMRKRFPAGPPCTESSRGSIYRSKPGRYNTGGRNVLVSDNGAMLFVVRLRDAECPCDAKHAFAAWSTAATRPNALAWHSAMSTGGIISQAHNSKRLPCLQHRHDV